MKKLQIAHLLIIAILASIGCKNGTDQQANVDHPFVPDQHRPYFHFTPDSMWMNDPNGMVFHDGVYHLFYQYYPDSTVWGPMHWGHATSKDMISWEHKPIALYPDQHGYIFSGSAILDIENTTGFGIAENPLLVAIYTYHDPVGAKEKKIDFQTQGIAYSLDNGDTWQKYEQNPVLLNPGIRDFRDPKVRWFEPTERWIMTLAVKDHIRFYSSPNLIEWKLESEFGKDIGAHGGVWECPDLFPLTLEGSDEQHWILIVSLNPGGPNGGSGTQYFVGEFDGTTFTPNDTNIRWIDFGPDDYAGVTWSNTGYRTLFIGWMSNWKYANIVPTVKWRSAMTIARELTLKEVGEDLIVHSMPVVEFDQYTEEVYTKENLDIEGSYSVSEQARVHSPHFMLDLEVEAPNDFTIELSNDVSNVVSLSYDKASNSFSIDRSKSGNTSFHILFGKTINASRYSSASTMDLKLIADAASLEVFADGGSTVLTSIYFPEKELDKLTIKAASTLNLKSLSLQQIKP